MRPVSIDGPLALCGSDSVVRLRGEMQGKHKMLTLATVSLGLRLLLKPACAFFAIALHSTPARLLRPGTAHTPDHGKRARSTASLYHRAPASRGKAHPLDCFAIALRTRLTRVSTPARPLRYNAACMPGHGKRTRLFASLKHCALAESDNHSKGEFV